MKITEIGQLTPKARAKAQRTHENVPRRCNSDCWPLDRTAQVNQHSMAPAVTLTSNLTTRPLATHAVNDRPLTLSCPFMPFHARSGTL